MICRRWNWYRHARCIKRNGYTPEVSEVIEPSCC